MACQEIIKGASRKFQGFFKEDTSMYQSSSHCVSRVFRLCSGYFRKLPKAFQETFKGVSRKIDVCCEGVLRMFQGCFKELKVVSSRVQKTPKSSYTPDPEILNLPTINGTRRQNDGTKLSYFVKLKTE